MNWKEYKPIMPFAVALPVVVGVFAWAFGALRWPALLPILLGIVFLLPFLGARRVPASPVRAGLLTVTPLLLLQILGLFVLGFVAFSEASSDPARMGALRGAGLMFVGSVVIGGNIVSFTLVSMLAGWVAKLTRRQKRKASNQKVDLIN